MHRADLDEASAEDRALSDEERTIVAEEEALAASVRSALERVEERDHDQRLRRQMTTLRSDLGTAAIDDVATIAAEAQRIRSTAAVRDRLKRPDPDQPYFAHMQLESDRGVRDVLLGQCSFIEPKHRIALVDWRAAPIAQVFFHSEEGDDYEQEFPDRSVEGVVLKRRVLAFDRGELVHIQTPSVSLRRDSEGRWTRDARVGAPKLEGGEGGAIAKRVIGTGLAGRRLPVISALLDATQYEALTRDARTPLLILGGAGCGKTTVALHRLAHLVYQDPDRYPADRLIVIVPEEGLVRLTRSLLEELGMEEIRVTTVDEWFVERGRHRFPRLSRELSAATPASVVRLKRHPAMAACLASVADEAGRACAEEIDRLLRAGGAFAALHAETGGAAAEPRLRAALRAWADRTSTDEFEAHREDIEHVFARLMDPDLDRERLFGDRVRLAEIVAVADGELPESVVERTIGWYRLQSSPSAEETYADVDAGRRAALDGRSLDAGTPDEDAGSIDVEDFAILLELARLKSGESIAKRGPGRPYTHMLLDEAQELSEVECRVLGDAVAPNGCVTVAGDPAQQIGDHAIFRGWDPLMGALGQGRAAPVTLQTSYRCTRPIVEFGHAVLGPLAPDPAPQATRDGAPVSRSQLASELHVSLALADALSDLVEREPMAQVAVIARESETAERLHDALARQLALRLVLDGRFAFKPGIDITTVQQVKGLEFDYVVIPDASAADYPDDSASRRMLHVAATRAIHQLWIVTHGPWSPVVPA